MTAKAKTKSKPKPKPKARAKPAAATAPVDVHTLTPPGATGFEDLTWGMTRAEVGKRYKLSRRNDVATTIAGVRVWVSFRFDGKNRLDHISVGSQERYAEWGDGDGDYISLRDWVTEKVGRPNATGSFWKWELPTTKIWFYVDESLGLYFEPPK